MCEKFRLVSWFFFFPFLTRTSSVCVRLIIINLCLEEEAGVWSASAFAATEDGALIETVSSRAAAVSVVLARC